MVFRNKQCGRNTYGKGVTLGATPILLLWNFSQTSVLKALIFSFMQSKHSSPPVPITFSVNEKKKKNHNLSLTHSWKMNTLSRSSSLESPHTLSVLLMKMTICVVFCLVGLSCFFSLGAFKVLYQLLIDYHPSWSSCSESTCNLHWHSPELQQLGLFSL